METRIVKVPVPEPGWDRELPRRYFSFAYPLPGVVAWIYDNLFGPSRRHRELGSFIPMETKLNEVSPEMKLGFIGDVMPMKLVHTAIGEDVKAFFADVDFLVVNLEGTIITGNPKSVILAQAHNAAILDLLEDLFPPSQTIVCCANNHSGDYGWNQFNHSYQTVKDRGFLAVGRRDEPAVLLGGKVNITTGTYWSNQPCAYVAKFAEIEAALAPEAAFQILYPHWGNELQLYPYPKQISLAQSLLAQWDMVVGQHPHCPQPVSTYKSDGLQKLVAYSLGDFTFGRAFQKYLFGLCAKVSLGPDSSGRWAAGEVAWRFSYLDYRDKSKAKVDLREACPYFPTIT